jgi:hypothetical protein
MIRVAVLLMLLAPATLFEEWIESGRIVGIADPLSERLHPPQWIAPGAPPILSFRTFDAADRGRFGSLGLMTDDAGH